MKRPLIWGLVAFFALGGLLCLTHRPQPVVQDKPLDDAARTIDRLQEGIGMIQEQAGLDTRQQIISALGDIYHDIDLLKEHPELTADRERLIRQADVYQGRLKHAPDYLIRAALLTHDFQWTDGSSPPEEVTFDDSGIIRGSSFFKDAHWDVIDGLLFINHVHWAMRLWYDPAEIRFEGQCIRDQRLRDSVPGGWIWDLSIPYSVVELTPVN